MLVMMRQIYLTSLVYFFVFWIVAAQDVFSLYGDDPVIDVITTLNDFETTVKKSDSIWMVQFFDSVEHVDQMKTVAPLFKELGRIVKGLFRLGVVDVSTDEGQGIAAPYTRSSEKGPFVVLLGEDKTTPAKTFSGSSLDLKEMVESFGFAASDLIATRTGHIPRSHPGFNNNNKHGDSSASSSSKTKSQNSNKRKTAYMKLKGADFEEKVLNNPQVVLVAFTAPWCGHCKRLEPEFKQAAKSLAGEEVLLAWVNAEEERELSGIYGVKGFPTIKMFPGGAPKSHSDAVDFQYERTAPTIIGVLLQEIARSGVPKEIPELTSSSVLEDECQGQNHICVLAALPHIIDTGADGRNKYLDLISQVSKSFKGTGAFSFLWFDGTQQPSMEKAFELTFGYPALVALSLDRQAYAVLHGSFTEKKITAFLHSITTGRQSTIKLQALPKVETVEAWDGKDGAPVEEEFDLAELMGDEF